MIELKYGDDLYNIKNKSNEITINDFQKIQNTLNEDSTFFFQSWLNIIELLSDKEGVKKLIGEDDFFEIVRNLHLKDFIITDEIEIDNIKYKARLNKNEQPSLSAFQFSEIEKLVKKYPDDYIVRTMCVIFNTDDENNNKFNNKIKAFGDNMTIDIALPFLSKAHKSLLDNLVKISEIVEDEK